VMFRLDQTFRWSLDTVASEREEDLNRVIAARMDRPYYRVHGLVERVYQGDRARVWMEPALTIWPARLMISSVRRRAEFQAGLNARFGLDHLRPMESADLQAAEDRMADFSRYVNESVLPLMLRDAADAGLTICFVRAQRRPAGDGPPGQSPALRRYIGDLQRYVTERGAIFRDDTGDPLMTLDIYGDGDHIRREARRRYTEIFHARLNHLFR